MRKIDELLAGQRTNIHARAKSLGGLAKQREAILAACFPEQRALAVDPGRRVAGLVARGGGKTTGLRARFLDTMLRTKNAECVYIATARTAAEDLMWGQLKALCEQHEVRAAFSESKLTMTLRQNGAKLELKGADDKREIEKLRGRPFHGVGIDEGASHPRQLLDALMYRIIGPRLGDYRGWLALIGTPGHILNGSFYDITRHGSPISRRYADRDLPAYKGWKKWSFHQWSLQQNTAMPHLWAEALEQKEANGWSDDNPIWIREYLGRWAADDTGNVYKFREHKEVDGIYVDWNVWTPGEKTKKNPYGLPAGHVWYYVIGIDLGARDPLAIQVFAFSESSLNMYHCDEHTIPAASRTTRGLAEHLAFLHAKVGEESVVGMVADSTHLGGMILGELRTVYGFNVEAAEQKNKNDAIELWNGDLVDGRIKLLRGSALVEEQLTLQYDEKGEKENDNQANHNSDAAIYARRKALHMFGQIPEKKPAPGSAEAQLAALEASEELFAQKRERELMRGDDADDPLDRIDHEGGW